MKTTKPILTRLERRKLRLARRSSERGAKSARRDKDGQHRSGKHAARAAICRDQGRPNTGRQWRLARKQLRAEVSA